jgi:hypothetical protein
MDTVIVKGSVKKEKDSKRLRALRMDYVRMYDYKPDWSKERNQILFRATPRVAHAWKARGCIEAL